MEGRLNKAKTPDGVERYLTGEFEQLVPFPTSKLGPSSYMHGSSSLLASICTRDIILTFSALAWQLRYNGIGAGVYKGDDNSEVEHGMDQIYQDGALSAEGGTHTSS